MRRTSSASGRASFLPALLATVFMGCCHSPPCSLPRSPDYSGPPAPAHIGPGQAPAVTADEPVPVGRYTGSDHNSFATVTIGEGGLVAEYWDPESGAASDRTLWSRGRIRRVGDMLIYLDAERKSERVVEYVSGQLYWRLPSGSRMVMRRAGADK
jgi:hypothetical protein